MMVETIVNALMETGEFDFIRDKLNEDEIWKFAMLVLITEKLKREPCKSCQNIGSAECDNCGIMKDGTNTGFAPIETDFKKGYKEGIAQAKRCIDSVFKQIL